jgi:hypothetical protein
MSRHSKFNAALTAKIIELYSQGLTDAQVARIIGISERTLNYWKIQKPEFLQSIKESKSIADDLVEASLFSRAVGYRHREEKLFIYEGNVVRANTTKHYPPETKAAIFWLSNRRPESWRNTHYINAGDKNPSQGSANNSAQEITFDKFCENAGYPMPYPKQIEMMDFGMGETEARLILGSRGYGKTDYVVILGLAWDIFNDRQSTNLIITKSKERNAAMLDEINKALVANGVTIDKCSATSLRVAGLHGKDHSVSTTTIKSISLRGRHPRRVIMDDPVTEDDASEKTREHVVRVYNEINKLTGNILILGQPAHKFDLYAKLRPLLKKMEVPHGTIPELDHDLDAQRQAGVDERSIQMSYFLKVPDEGTTPFDSIKYVDLFPTGDSAVAWIDPSYEGGDYTALCILKAHMDGVAVVGFVYKKAWNHCLDEMVAKLKKYNVKRLAFETNNLGDQPVIMLGQLLSQTGVGIVGRKSTLEKHSKIMAAGAYAHLIHLSKESDMIFQNQVVQYEYKAKHDDAPDSLASCLEWLGLIRGKR